MTMVANDIFLDSQIYSPSVNKNARAEKVAGEVESLFVYELMKEMDSSIDRESSDMLFSDAEKTYRQMFNQELSREMTKYEGLGLKAMILEDMERRGEIENPEEIK